VRELLLELLYGESSGLDLGQRPEAFSRSRFESGLSAFSTMA
jgi:hypothetical protein